MGNKKDEKLAGEIDALVVKAQKGDHDSFAKLYDHFIDLIYRYVFYRVNRNDVEDIVETVFLKVWQHLKKYKKGKSSFSAWIFRITHNLVVDYYRAQKDSTIDELDVQIPDPKREHNPIRVTENILEQEVLKEALSKLKKGYRDLLIHKFINDFSNKEIAEIMKKSEGSVRILQFRALRALKRELEEMGVDYSNLV